MIVFQVSKTVGITKHVIRFTSTIKVEDPGPADVTTLKLLQPLKERLSPGGWSVQLTDGSISVESVLVKVEDDEDDKKKVYVSWTNQDEDIGSYIFDFLQAMFNE